MNDKVNVSEWVNSFLNEEFSGEDIKTQIKAGWYDWFCRDSSLRNKTYRMGRIVRQIKCGGKVDLNNWYVWFKNNCPMRGPLYDDFRFADLETGDVQFTIQLDSPWEKFHYVVYGRMPNGECHFDTPMFETNSSRELVKWLNTPWEE